jgi:hypothetical protein
VPGVERSEAPGTRGWGGRALAALDPEHPDRDLKMVNIFEARRTIEEALFHLGSWMGVRVVDWHAFGGRGGVEVGIA